MPKHAQMLTPDTIAPCGWPGGEVRASLVTKASGCSLGTTVHAPRSQAPTGHITQLSSRPGTT
ncbi:MAG: hypothetical protein ABSG36_07020 [Acidimicrobiales bacterium]